MEARDIKSGGVYQSSHEPPIVAVLVTAGDGEKPVALKTEKGMEITVPLDEFMKEWTVVQPMPYRYFVNYTVSDMPTVQARCFISRNGLVRDGEDIEEMEKFIAEKIIVTNSPDIKVRILGWKAFEQPPALLDALTAAMGLLTIVAANEPKEAWFSVEFRAELQRLLGGE